MTVIHKIRKYVRFGDLIDLIKAGVTRPFGWALRGRRPHLWLIAERGDEARDNGYWLFRHIRENHPQLPVHYAIRFSSPDYPKIAPLGNLIPYGSLRHHVYFWAAEKYASPHIGNGFPAPFVCRQLLLRGAYKTKIIFLQHGVTISVPDFLTAEKNRVDLFAVSSERERRAVLRDLHYAPEQVKTVGLCRFDDLFDFKADSKQILIMPTWRWWLNPAYNQSTAGFEQTVRDSRYIRAWNGLLQSEAFAAALQKHDLRAVFLPHPQMRPYAHLFEFTNPRIRMAGAEEGIGGLLKSSAFLITDYSSVFFDFAYMGKPMLYFQFDTDEFRERHYPEGYFHYDRDGFGPIVTAVDEAAAAMDAAAAGGFKTDPIYAARANAFFAYRDRGNCGRTFDMIKKLKVES